MDTKNKPEWLDKPNVVIYITFPGDNLHDVEHEINQFGYFSFSKIADSSKYRTIFNRGAGYVIFEELVNQNRTDILEKIRIFNKNGQKYTIEQILKKLEKVDQIR